MNLINKINEYIDNGRIVFLSGAGCSKDSPSNLPLGNQVIQDLVDFSCIEGEKKDLKEQLHRKLRFEHFMQLFTNYIDPEINALNFFTQCHSPNFQHCFLAEAIKKRNYVMTTNFDNLIEYALQNQGIPKENIYPLIFKKDYSSFNEASEVPQERNYPIIKLHGSITNFRNKNSTKESLIFNIETLGKEKNLSNLRTLKSYKVDFLRKILKNHYLVVLGYSGADDFDIIPTLKRLRNFKGIIWLKHNSIQNEVKIQEIKCSNKSQKPIPDPIYKFLYDLKDFNNECEIFIIEGQTSLVLKQIKKVKFLQKPNKFNLDFKNWVQDNIKKPNILQSQFLTEKIYLDLNLF
ncbi:MAG: SIR2 family protein, partial [Candidatus Lokiarchaeota archaeon]